MLPPPCPAHSHTCKQKQPRCAPAACTVCKLLNPLELPSSGLLEDPTESKAQRQARNKLLPWWLNERAIFILPTPWVESQVCFMLPIHFPLIKCHSITSFGIGKSWVYTVHLKTTLESLLHGGSVFLRTWWTKDDLGGLLAKGHGVLPFFFPGSTIIKSF